MLQNLVKCSCTRRVTADVVFGSPPSIIHTSRRFYTTGMNEDLIDLLRECAEEEENSAMRDMSKVRSFRKAAIAIEKFDFKIQHSNQLKGIPKVGVEVTNRINRFLGHAEKPLFNSPERFKKRVAIKELLTVPGIGATAAEALYDAGCDSIAKLHLNKYKGMLRPGARVGFKYMNHLESPVPRENAKTLVEFFRYSLPTNQHEFIIAGDYRRNAPTILGPIEILIVDRSVTDPIPTPPHPSTLKLSNLGSSGSKRSARKRVLFSKHYMSITEKATSVLLNKIVMPLAEMGVTADTIAPGNNLWQGWMRVPKKGQLWEPLTERIDGVQKLEGDFHQVNITYISKQSRGSALLALTGDEDYYLDCRRKAIQAGLYLDEWGLWQWEPNSQSLSRFQTSDAPYKKISLGAMWGSETKADKGRWVQLETIEEEQVLNAIGGEYVPPSRRNFGFIVGKRKPEEGVVSIPDPL